MKILIFEAYSDANIGSASLIENSINLIKQKYPNAKIELLAQNVESVKTFSGYNSYEELFSFPFSQHRIKQLFWVVKSFLWMIIHLMIRTLQLPIPEKFYTYNHSKLVAIEKIKKADICISIGAERINDNFVLVLPFCLYTMWVITNYKKRIILFPQTIGPFHYNITKKLSAYIIKRCNYIFLRDYKSVSIVKNLGIKFDNFSFMPDVAILQKAIDQKRINQILEMENINYENRAIVGISVMEWSYFKAPLHSTGYEGYKDAVSQITDYLIEELGYYVIYVPTNVKIHGCREDDIKATHDIYQLIRNKGDVAIVENLYRPSEIMGLFKIMDFLLVTRMHACILATSAYVPTCSINYQFKLFEYMKLLGLDKNTVDIHEVNFESLKNIIDYTYINRNDIQQKLKKKISELKSKFEILKDTI
ncbi:MAG: polysaccharide pyruvyl transferase family protein [Spirochaetota bacterium]|nr:polysaccharide pyruvyl transferase family protein [Spirochaetota bacterium]